MKRFILFLIINCALCITHCAAQYPEYAVGIRGGTTWSFMWLNPPIAQPSMPLTYHGGAQFRMVSEKYFYVYSLRRYVVELDFIYEVFEC